MPTIKRKKSKVSDADKSMANSDYNFAVLKHRSAGDKKNFTYSLEPKGGLGGLPNNELIATPKKKAKPFVPTYGGKVGGKMSNGAGWGGEPKLKTKKDPMSMLKRGMQGKSK